MSPPIYFDDRPDAEPLNEVLRAIEAAQSHLHTAEWRVPSDLSAADDALGMAAAAVRDASAAVFKAKRARAALYKSGDDHE